MPRCFAHRGVSGDGGGLTPAQDPFFWFAGRTAHPPWTGIRMVGEGRPMNPVPRALKVFLRHPDGVTVAPTRCSSDIRAVNEPPASVHEPLTQVAIRLPRRRYVETLRTVQAPGPDPALSV